MNRLTNSFCTRCVFALLLVGALGGGSAQAAPLPGAVLEWSHSLAETRPSSLTFGVGANLAKGLLRDPIGNHTVLLGQNPQGEYWIRGRGSELTHTNRLKETILARPILDAQGRLTVLTLNKNPRPITASPSGLRLQQFDVNDAQIWTSPPLQLTDASTIVLQADHAGNFLVGGTWGGLASVYKLSAEGAILWRYRERISDPGPAGSKSPETLVDLGITATDEIIFTSHGETSSQTVDAITAKLSPSGQRLWRSVVDTTPQPFAFAVTDRPLALAISPTGTSYLLATAESRFKLPPIGPCAEPQVGNMQVIVLSPAGTLMRTNPVPGAGASLEHSAALRVDEHDRLVVSVTRTTPGGGNGLPNDTYLQTTTSTFNQAGQLSWSTPVVWTNLPSQSCFLRAELYPDGNDGTVLGALLSSQIPSLPPSLAFTIDYGFIKFSPAGAGLRHLLLADGASALLGVPSGERQERLLQMAGDGHLEVLLQTAPVSPSVSQLQRVVLNSDLDVDSRETIDPGMVQQTIQRPVQLLRLSQGDLLALTVASQADSNLVWNLNRVTAAGRPVWSFSRAADASVSWGVAQMVVGPDDAVWLVVSSKGEQPSQNQVEINRISNQGKLLGRNFVEIPEGFYGPSALTLGQQGSLWIVPARFFVTGFEPSSPVGPPLIKVSASGVREWARDLAPGILSATRSFLAPAPDGSVWVTTSGRVEEAGIEHAWIYRISPTGEILWSNRFENEVMSGLAVDSGSQVYVSSYNYYDFDELATRRLSAAGELLTTYHLPPTPRPPNLTPTPASTGMLLEGSGGVFAITEAEARDRILATGRASYTDDGQRFLAASQKFNEWLGDGSGSREFIHLREGPLAGHLLVQADELTFLQHYRYVPQITANSGETLIYLWGTPELEHDLSVANQLAGPWISIAKLRAGVMGDLRWQGSRAPNANTFYRFTAQPR